MTLHVRLHAHVLDELRATLAGMLKQPATRIASVIVAPAGGIARVLAAHAEKSNEAA